VRGRLLPLPALRTARGTALQGAALHRVLLRLPASHPRGADVLELMARYAVDGGSVQVGLFLARIVGVVLRWRIAQQASDGVVEETVDAKAEAGDSSGAAVEGEGEEAGGEPEAQPEGVDVDVATAGDGDGNGAQTASGEEGTGSASEKGAIDAETGKQERGANAGDGEGEGEEGGGIESRKLLIDCLRVSAALAFAGRDTVLAPGVCIPDTDKEAGEPAAPDLAQLVVRLVDLETCLKNGGDIDEVIDAAEAAVVSGAGPSSST